MSLVNTIPTATVIKFDFSRDFFGVFDVKSQEMTIEVEKSFEITSALI